MSVYTMPFQNAPQWAKFVPAKRKIMDKVKKRTKPVQKGQILENAGEGVALFWKKW